MSASTTAWLDLLCPRCVKKLMSWCEKTPHVLDLIKEGGGGGGGFDGCNRPSNLAQMGAKSSFFDPYDIEIWRMTSKNNRAPLPCS